MFFSFDCRKTGVRLEVIRDREMHDMFESGMRCGLAIVPRRWAKANNPSVTTAEASGEGGGDRGCYDPDKPASHIIHYNVNNIYDHAMSQKMPVDGHRWLTRDELDCLDVNAIEDDAETGYVLEVDLDYPQELCVAHNELPLAPEMMKITIDQLSPYSRRLAEDCGFKIKDPPKRLIAGVGNKRRYVVDYRCLKLYLRLGLKLVQIHRAIRFKQSFWLKEYVDLNIDICKHASNEFDKTIFQFMNTALFEGTFEDARKHIDARLVNDSTQLAELTARNQFVKAEVITRDLVSVHSKHKKMKLTSPVYLGFAVMELSKALIYKFHYDVIKARYNDRSILCYTDRDSLIYLVETDDIYKDMRQSSENYDTSNFPCRRRGYSRKNMGVAGKLLDVNAGLPIYEFIGLRAKMFSYTMTFYKYRKTAKRVSIMHQSYVKALWDSQNEPKT